MKKNYYLRHDVSAAEDQKLIVLMEQEGARGYGLYWLLLEVLFRQPKMSASLDLLGGLAHRFRTKKVVLQRVVECYDLFERKDGMFHSPGLDKRMRPLIAVQEADDRPQLTPQDLHNSLIASGKQGHNARIAEQSREENFNYSRREEPAAAAVVVAPDMEPPLLPIRCWESLVDEMAADRSWMDMVGAHSGLGQLYIDHCAAIVDLFRQHIRLYDRGGGLLRLCEVRSYFVNYLSAGSRTCQGVRAKLLEGLQQQKTQEGISPHETLVDGQRTYLGRPIPHEAPPRPNQYAVWDESARKWGR